MTTDLPGHQQDRALPGLCDGWKDDLLLLNKRLQDSTLGGQQGGLGGHADGLLVIQAKEWKVMFHNLL